MNLSQDELILNRELREMPQNVLTESQRGRLIAGIELGIAAQKRQRIWKIVSATVACSTVVAALTIAMIQQWNFPSDSKPNTTNQANRTPIQTNALAQWVTSNSTYPPMDNSFPDSYWPTTFELMRDSPVKPVMIPSVTWNVPVNTIHGSTYANGYFFSVQDKATGQIITTVMGNHEGPKEFSPVQEMALLGRNTVVLGQNVQAATYTKTTYGDIIDWQHDNWTYRVRGVADAGTEKRISDTAARIVSDIEKHGPMMQNVESGYMVVEERAGESTHAKIYWTYDHDIWYSIESGTVDGAMQLTRRMVPLAGKETTIANLLYTEELETQLSELKRPLQPTDSYRLSHGKTVDQTWCNQLGLEMNTGAPEKIGSRLYLAGKEVMSMSYDKGTLYVSVGQSQQPDTIKSVVWNDALVPQTFKIVVQDSKTGEVYKTLFPLVELLPDK